MGTHQIIALSFLAEIVSPNLAGSGRLKKFLHSSILQQTPGKLLKKGQVFSAAVQISEEHCLLCGPHRRLFEISCLLVLTCHTGILKEAKYLHHHICSLSDPPHPFEFGCAKIQSVSLFTTCHMTTTPRSFVYVAEGLN